MHSEFFQFFSIASYFLIALRESMKTEWQGAFIKTIFLSSLCTFSFHLYKNSCNIYENIHIFSFGTAGSFFESFYHFLNQNQRLYKNLVMKNFMQDITKSRNFHSGILQTSNVEEV